MSDQFGRVIRIERTFAASAEEVFDAWTSPDVMRRWFRCDSAWDTPVAEVDLQVGGKIRVVMRRPGGTEVEAHGIFTLIDRPHRLIMTWTFDDDPSNEQLLELSFIESKGATTVLLVNSRISTDERRKEQANGWQGCLDELDRLLAN
ncbi:MAG: SRPBCC domain-containing protein [Solirubrobacteraceae bacterium]